MVGMVVAEKKRPSGFEHSMLRVKVDGSSLAAEFWLGF